MGLITTLTEKYGATFSASTELVEIVKVLTNAQLFPHTRMAYETDGNSDNIHDVAKTSRMGAHFCKI